MTATDELRKLLNERGVEHSDFASAYRLSTRWQDNSRRVIEHQLRKDADIGDMGIVRNLTPEQAIEATLGRGECKNVSDPPEGFYCSSCGWGDFAEPSHLLTTAKFTDNDGGPNYCPNCGKPVKR